MPTDDGVRVRGVLRSSRDGSPAAGERLGFISGEQRAITYLVTDAAGRFETEPVSTGIVRVWQAVEQTKRLEVEPQQFLVPFEAGERVHERDLVLVEAAAHLRVQVRAHGVPMQATLWLVQEPSSAQGDTDSQGRCELSIRHIEAGDELSLYARTDFMASRHTRLLFPWPDEVVVLDLLPTGRIRARVRDEDGRPVRVYVHTDDGEGAFTDEQGLAVIRLVPSGPLLMVGCGDQVEPAQVRVPPDGQVELEFVLPATEVVAAGRVVDETGEGVAYVALRAENAEGSGMYVSERSRSDGTFELRVERGRRGSSVRVIVSQGAADESYAPREQLVPAGQRGLVFRRQPSPERIDFSIAVFDANTHAPLDGALIFQFRGPSPSDEQSYPARDGMAPYCTIRPYDDARLCARAIGHVDAVLLWSELSEEARARKLVTFELESGYEQDVRVRDGQTLAPIAGARVLAGNALVGVRDVGVTDAQGRAHVRLPNWPEALAVAATGYEGGSYGQKGLLAVPIAEYRLTRAR